MREKVLLTAYRQRVATLYSSQNFTILDSQMIGNPEIQSLRASEYKEIWDKIFIANSLSSVDDKTMIASLTWSLGWLMRHYDDDYPDDNATPLVHLQNFLAIPIQFTIACIIYANSTLNLDTPLFRLPNEMITTASGGMSMQRFVGQTWTLAVFIAAGGTLILLVLAILLWMITQKAALPSISGIPEIDIMVRAENSTTGERIDGLGSLCEAVETRRLIEAKWPYRMAWSIQKMRLAWTSHHRVRGGTESASYHKWPDEREQPADRSVSEEAKKADPESQTLKTG